MAIVERPAEPATTHRLLTIADVAVLPNDLPSGAIDYELDNGRLILVSPPSARHNRLEVLFVTQFVLQGESLGHGKAWGRVGVVLWRGPDRLVETDSAFTATRSLPVRESREGYLESVPNLIVEIRSKNDSIRELTDKAADYITAGAELVWVVDPQRMVVGVHRPNAAAVDLGMNDVLTADNIIPGFRLALADVFAEEASRA